MSERVTERAKSAALQKFQQVLELQSSIRSEEYNSEQGGPLFRLPTRRVTSFYVYFMYN